MDSTSPELQDLHDALRAFAAALALPFRSPTRNRTWWTVGVGPFLEKGQDLPPTMGRLLDALVREGLGRLRAHRPDYTDLVRARAAARHVARTVRGTHAEATRAHAAAVAHAEALRARARMLDAACARTQAAVDAALGALAPLAEALARHDRTGAFSVATPAARDRDADLADLARALGLEAPTVRPRPRKGSWHAVQAGPFVGKGRALADAQDALRGALLAAGHARLKARDPGYFARCRAAFGDAAQRRALLRELAFADECAARAHADVTFWAARVAAEDAAVARLQADFDAALGPWRVLHELVARHDRQGVSAVDSPPRERCEPLEFQAAPAEGDAPSPDAAPLRGGVNAEKPQKSANVSGTVPPRRGV